ncbi:UNVERIFIED_CONTAM: hypothetical protein Slati_0837000 [Sesamum latifolium]|uniref:Integrase zinc-binding domain-containing protein n=1 Tax=Sesamum latifolium TaxID=2727402 RepID=A0AAW2XLJ9_9LAMI
MVTGIKQRKITVMVTEMPAIEEEVVNIIEEEGSWKQPFFQYLKNGTLPSDLFEAKRVQFKANRFTMLSRELYKKTPDGLLLKCLDDGQAGYVLREINEGSCGNHSGGRSLAQKILWQGYFWPTLVADAMEFSKKCENCQKFANLMHSPTTPLEAIKIACPFD